MFMVSFTNDLKASEYKTSVWIKVAKVNFYKFGEVSQFLEN